MSNELNTILAYSADDINGLDSKGLIAAYNALAASLNKKSVNRFADRATGQKRLSALIEEARAAAPKAEPVNVTDAEFIALQTCLNYDTREAQLSDNYSNGGHDAFKKALGWNDQAVAALIGSLESKGLAYSDNEGVNGNKFNTVWLTEKGVNVVFDLIDAGRACRSPEGEGRCPGQAQGGEGPARSQGHQPPASGRSDRALPRGHQAGHPPGHAVPSERRDDGGADRGPERRQQALDRSHCALRLRLGHEAEGLRRAQPVRRGGH